MRKNQSEIQRERLNKPYKMYSKKIPTEQNHKFILYSIWQCVLEHLERYIKLEIVCQILTDFRSINSLFDRFEQVYMIVNGCFVSKKESLRIEGH